MSVVERAITAPAAGLSSTSPASTQVDDAIIVFTWEVAGAGSPTHTLQGGQGWTQLWNHAHNDGSTDGQFSAAVKLATSSGANSYQAFTSSGGGAPLSPFTGISVIQAGTFDTTFANWDIGAPVTATGNGPPNPPAVTGLTIGDDYLIQAIGTWHFTVAGSLTPTAMANYTLSGSVAGAQLGELAWCNRTMDAIGATSEDPGAYTDNLTPSGTVAVTLAIPEVVAADVTLTPSAITALGAMVAPAVNILIPLVASLATALMAAPTVDISSGLTLSPSPIVATASTPAPTVDLLARPPPVVSVAATGTPTVLVRVLPAASIATAATGIPVTAVLKAVTPNIATASSTATVVRVVVPLTAPIAVASTPAPFVVGEGLVVPVTAIIATAATGTPVVLSSVQATAILASASTPAQTVRVLIPLTALIAVASTGSAVAITGALNVAASATIVSNIPTPATVAPADSPAATISSDGTITAIVADLAP